MAQDEDDLGGDVLIPLSVSGEKVYLAVKQLGTPAAAEEESEIAARRPTLDDVVGGLSAFAGELSTKLRSSDAGKITIEFGCEVAVESGRFIAVIGKASAKSTFKVALEWTKPTA